MHPLFSDPSSLSDKELADKIFDLSRKISLSYRMGNAYLVGLANLIMESLMAEQANRQQKELSDLMAKHGKGKSLGIIAAKLARCMFTMSPNSVAKRAQPYLAPSASTS